MSTDPTIAETLARLQREVSFRDLVGGLGDYAVFMLTPNGLVATWNAGARRIKGYEPHEIIGRHFSTFYLPEAKASGWPQVELERAAELGRFEDEGWRVRRDGSRFWANVVITAIRSPGGELLGYSKVTRDLTERRANEERLRVSEENLRLLVEGVKDHAVFMLAPDGRVREWNAGAQRVHGFEGAAVLGHDLSILYTADDRASGRPARDLAAARDAGAYSEAGWRERPDGSRFWADVTLTALRGADGTLRGYAHLTRDLTERRRIQELEVEGRRITEFIAMLAHELRNPLAPIANAVAILDRSTEQPDLRWCAALIGRQVDHLTRLVDDLLDVSRITSGKIQLRREPLELGALVSTACESVRPLVERQRHVLHVAVPAQPLQVDGDATRLTQLVVNLLTNAAKYTPAPGRIDVTVERVPGPPARAQIRVADNGMGMSRALIERAFDLFVQGERALDRADGGLGIGLTLVRRIAELHGGQASAESAGPGRGTQVSVALPLAGDDAAATSGTPAAAAPAPAQHRRVLVVDDNVDSAQTMAMLLQTFGHEVQVVHDGHAALPAALREPPHLVLLDIGLPGLSGYDVARRLRAQPELAGLRIVAMTGYGRDTDRAEAAQAGFDAHLVKPVDPEAVLRQLALAGSATEPGAAGA